MRSVIREETENERRMNGMNECRKVVRERKEESGKGKDGGRGCGG